MLIVAFVDLPMVGLWVVAHIFGLSLVACQRPKTLGWSEVPLYKRWKVFFVEHGRHLICIPKRIWG